MIVADKIGEATPGEGLDGARQDRWFKLDCVEPNGAFLSPLLATINIRVGMHDKMRVKSRPNGRV